MTTFAPDRDGARKRKEQLDELTRQAWADYKDSLRDLTGRVYEETEDDSWERLQETLRDLTAQREAPVGDVPATPGRTPEH